MQVIYIYIYSITYSYLDEGDPKAPFLIAATPIAPLYPWSLPYNAKF